MIHRESVWIEPKQPDIPADLLEFAGNNSFLAGELFLRGFQSVIEAQAFLEPANYQTTSPYDLTDMEIAVDLLVQAINHNDLIGVWGDFDVDGQTSTTILVEGLRKLGARVNYHIPVRGKESHGISIEILKQFLAEGVDLLLTCDTGITSHEQIEFAKAQGKRVIITDHHSLPDILPGSDANINPRRLPDNHPLSTLCGAGTAYKLVEALLNYYQRGGELEQFLDLVALGTVADVADLSGDNRYLVQMGINKLRQGSRLAIKAMAEAAGITLHSMNEEQISFGFAPRLNSIGRLGDANPMVNFLTSNDSQEVTVMASHLEGLNIHRRLIVDQVIKAALDQIEQNPETLNGNALVLLNPQWPAGVLGIAASRLVELYHMPAVLLTSDGDRNTARGSARSIEGIDISKAFNEQRAVLNSFGGHPMAAGLALPVENIPAFQKGLAETIEKMTGGVDLTPRLMINSYLTLDQIDTKIMDALELLAPYGPGNPLPVLVARGLTILNKVPIGRNEDHSQLIVQDAKGSQHKVIWWQSASLPAPQGVFDLAYSIRKSNYRGQEEVQIEWVDFRNTNDSDTPAAIQKSKLLVIDHRCSTQPEKVIHQMIAENRAQVWAESVQSFTFASANRLELKPSQTLILATTPPSLAVLRSILSTVLPKKLILFNLDSDNDSLQTFLQQLSGMVFYTIQHRGGWLSFEELSAHLCHNEETVRLGIQWLVHNGTIKIVERMSDKIQVNRDGNRDEDKRFHTAKNLSALLEETRAFRSYYQKKDPSIWINQIQETG